MGTSLFPVTWAMLIILDVGKMRPGLPSLSAMLSTKNLVPWLSETSEVEG